MALMGRYLPAPPEGVESPLAWGTVDHVRGMFEPHGIELEFGTGTTVVEFDDIDAFYERFDANFGPGLVAMAMLGDKWAQVRRERRALQDEFITPIVGGYRLRQDYLVTVGRKPA